MRLIPTADRKLIDKDPYFKVCLFDHLEDVCEGEVEVHHALKYAGKQVNEMFAYHPGCKCNHHKAKMFKLYTEYISIKKGLEILLIKYPKYDWLNRLRFLSEFFEADLIPAVCGQK